jgi:hypothetical protein
VASRLPWVVRSQGLSSIASWCPWAAAAGWVVQQDGLSVCVAGKTGRFRLEVSANVDIFVTLAPPHPRTDPIPPPHPASRARRPRSAFP